MPAQPFTVVVDYAHSPAALEHVLDLLAPLAAARGGALIVLFGSAGERDRAKRPDHGPRRGPALSSRGADRRGPPRRGPR